MSSPSGFKIRMAKPAQSALITTIKLITIITTITAAFAITGETAKYKLQAGRNCRSNFPLLSAQILTVRFAKLKGMILD